MKRWLLIEVELPDSISFPEISKIVEVTFQTRGGTVGFIGNYPNIKDVETCYPLIKGNRK